MITAVMVKVFVVVASAVIGILPTSSSLPSSIDSAFTWLSEVLAPWNAVFPVSTLLNVIVLILGIEAVLMVFSIFNFIVNKVRGSGS